ncbi:MAG TPA: glycosyltransferase family 39 protein [Syntrophales bacterium]|nr:glycosyltransferase family 39 protein [Syntrophales bacterium]HPB70139.1 glycosyltransferase family 39 protein [Syntrophales bacterium]
MSPDSHLYFQQAKALYYGLFDQLLAYYIYVSPYPITVSLFYSVCGNWIVAAQGVNILFGTLTIAVLYGLLRRFFADGVAALGALVFAFLPTFAEVSRDALRDPMFWFFSALGLYLFILHIEKRRPLLLLGCSLCLALAAWARFEAGLYIAATAGWIFFLNRPARGRDLLVFGLPYAFLGSLFLGLSFYLDLSLVEILNPKRILNLPLNIIAQYDALRDELKILARPAYIIGIKSYFFDRIRSLLWIIALVAPVVLIVETLFYVFFVVLIGGAVSSLRRRWADGRIRYLAVVSILALGALYLQTLYTWHGASRHLAVFILPSFVFIGAGIEAGHALLRWRFRYRPAAAYALVGTVVLLTLLPPVLWVNFDRDKLVYREIGRYIAKREANTRPVNVCGAFKRVVDVQFYANLNTPSATFSDYRALFHEANALSADSICRAPCDYLVRDEKGWRESKVDFSHPSASCTFRELERWPSRKQGALILYEVSR